MVVLDFETRSRVDIRSRGASLYCSDDSTDVLCLSWSRNGKDVQTWDYRLNPDQKPPEELVDLIGDGPTADLKERLADWIDPKDED